MTKPDFITIARMFYLQRCGVSLSAHAGSFAHQACHTTPARVFDTDTFLRVSGGWHDAGDYGRYVVPACKTVADLLLAFRAAPEAFGDDWNIPESGNGVADVLDEVRFALNWLLLMQDSRGGVHHKVSCANFPDMVAPQEETDELIVFPVSTTATGDFAAVMAMAFTTFRLVDRTFARRCLHAAERAYRFLKDSDPAPFYNPPGVVTGEYGDENDRDERYFAACALFEATGCSEYLDDAAALYRDGRSADFGWADVGGYGNVLLFFGERICADESLAGRIRADLLAAADAIVKRSEDDPYGVSLSSFAWGSNMYLLHNAMTLLYANDAQEDDRYLLCAKRHLSYIFGGNALGMSFVTGVGPSSPKNPHHRPSVALKKTMPGMLVGGPNQYLEDIMARALLSGKPAAECYIDVSESYSTNEVATYWNSPLLFVAARLCLSR
jgi:endoglucanase